MSNLTDKQEKFAQLVVKLGNQSEAYRQAYDVTDPKADWIPSKASHLIAEDNIKARIQEIRDGAKARNQIDLDTIVRGLLKIVDQADEVFDLANLKDASKDETRRFYRLMSQTNNSHKIAAYKEIARLLKLDDPEADKGGTTNVTNFYFNEKSND